MVEEEISREIYSGTIYFVTLILNKMPKTVLITSTASRTVRGVE